MAMKRWVGVAVLAAIGGAAGNWALSEQTAGDDRGVLIDEIAQGFADAAPATELSRDAIDEEWLDQLMVSMLRDGVDSARHGSMFRAFAGPFSAAETAVVSVVEDDEGLQRYVPTATFLMVEDRVKMAIVQSDVGALNGQTPEDNLAFLQSASVALSQMVGADPDPALIETLLAEVLAGELTTAEDHPFVTGTLERLDGSVATYVFVEYQDELGPESAWVIVARSVIADRCPPLDEANFYARYICEDGLGAAAE